MQCSNDALRQDGDVVLRGERAELGEFLLFSGFYDSKAIFRLNHLQFVQQSLQRQLCVGHDGDLGLVIRARDHRVRVDMDHLRALGRIAPALGGHRAGAAADEHHQVRLRQRFSRRQRAAIRADHAQAKWMVLGKAALAAHGGRHRRAEQGGERFQLRLRMGDHHAAAADENGQFRGRKRNRRLLNQIFVR